MPDTLKITGLHGAGTLRWMGRVLRLTPSPMTPPSYCRFRQVMVENEPDVQEVTGLFRTILLEALDWMRDEEEAERLSRQWNNKRVASTSLMGFRSRVRIDPFGSSEVKTISEDVERGLVRSSEGAEEARRGWSMPDFKHNKGM